ncbi:MAG: efflux transporter outer membrane subunit [Thermoguttaceae bacterium]
MRPRISHLLVAAALFLASGCTSPREYVHNGFKVGPNYCPPKVSTEQHWIDANDARIGEKSDVAGHWWTVFNDPVLNHLIECAASQNLSLREAGFRVLQARAQLGIAKGELFPQTQNMQLAYDRYAFPGGSFQGFSYPESFGDQWNLRFNLTWELDFWGRFRRAVLSAEDSLDASVAGYDGVLVTLLADVATDYVQIRTLQRRIRCVTENAELQRKLVNAAQRRQVVGQTGRLDLAQTSSVLDQTESQIPQLRITLRQTCDRLCVLMGMPPFALDKQIGEGPIPTAPKEVAVGIPADLLRRRPDVRRAERLAAAQGEQIGIATADLYPRMGIMGQLGWQAANFARFTAPTAFNSYVGPAFQWEILNYGRIVNNVKLQDAQFQELLTAYRNAVLQADSEAEDALVAFLQAHDGAACLDRSVKHAEEARDILVAQYEAGAVDPTRLMLVAQTLVQQQDLQAQAHGQIALGLVQVYRALGGGWETPISPFSPEEIPAPPPLETTAPTQKQPAPPDHPPPAKD